jgi:hypothetical protein
MTEDKPCIRSSPEGRYVSVEVTGWSDTDNGFLSDLYIYQTFLTPVLL